MKHLLSALLLLALSSPLSAQRMLSLDSCRAMALRNNKQLSVARVSQDVATNVRKAARTQYLPKVDALGSYQYFSREISLLSQHQKQTIGSLGTTTTTAAASQLGTLIGGMAQQGIITPTQAQLISQLSSQLTPQLAAVGDALGQQFVDAFHTDTKHVWAGSVMVRQPLFMGGAIVAANKMADIGEDMARITQDQRTQATLYDIDQTYWLVVSLRQKHRLAETYNELVGKFSSDVHKMIDEGVATRADGLKVDVRRNEAEMQLTQAEDGLTLSKMLLCQLIGLPLNDDITLADESTSSLDIAPATSHSALDTATAARPELQLLESSVELSRQAEHLARATQLPHVLLTGGYTTSNPNLWNGFQRHFTGVWNVGVTVQVPVWNWMEGAYKMRAARAHTTIARLELDDAREKVSLQVAQCRLKLGEASRKLAMARAHIASAEENLRCANLGFREGVMSTTDVMSAQTAWQLAQTQRIDAEIGIKMAEVGLAKALGHLTANP